MNMDIFESAEGFDWDDHNIEKIIRKHGVTPGECEEALLGELIVYFDDKHSQNEIRYIALGETFSGKLLFIVLTIRKNKVRIISARPMSRKEREVYYEKI